MRIRYIETADFRRCDLSLFQMFYQDHMLFTQSLKKDDVVVFVSKKGNQLLFVHGFVHINEGYEGARFERTVLASTRYRLLNTTWNPLMLANYAEAAGLKIQGLKLFEEHYKELVAARARRAA